MKPCHTTVIKVLACCKVLVQALQNDRKHSKANHLWSVYSGAKFTVFRHTYYTLYCSPGIYVQADLVFLCLVFNGAFEDYSQVSYKRKVCGKAEWGSSIDIIFNSVCLLCVSVSHFEVVLCLQTFSQLLCLLWWSVISDVRHF